MGTNKHQLVFEKRIGSVWIDANTDGAGFTGLSFLAAFQKCVTAFHDWPATIVGCHLDETANLAEFFVIEGGVHAEYRLREVGGDD